MNTTTNAAQLLNVLSLLVCVSDSADRQDAEDSADFFWTRRPGALVNWPLSSDEQHMAPRF